MLGWSWARPFQGLGRFTVLKKFRFPASGISVSDLKLEGEKGGQGKEEDWVALGSQTTAWLGGRRMQSLQLSNRESRLDGSAELCGACRLRVGKLSNGTR